MKMKMKMKVMQSHKLYMAVLSIQFVYAGMALLSKAAILKGMNPYVFVVYRQAFASLALAPFAFFFESDKAAPLSYRIICKIFFVSLFGLTVSFNLYYTAISCTSATFAAASTNIIPAITFIMALLARMERVAIKEWYGMAKVFGSVVGVCGALVFAFVKGPPLKLMKWADDQVIEGCSKVDMVKGSLMMLAANTAWSLWLVLQGPIIKEYPAKVRLTTLQCTFSCIQSAFWAVAMDRNPSSWKLGWDLHLLSVAYCGVMVNGSCYWVQMWVIEKKGAVFTAMFTPVALLITAIISAFLWKEKLYCGSVGGAILLVGGLYLVLWGKKKEEEDRKRVTEADVEESQVEGKGDITLHLHITDSDSVSE